MGTLFLATIRAGGVFSANRIILAIPIEVRVATGSVYRVALQPPGGAGVVLPCTDMVQARFGNPLVPICPVPSERLMRAARAKDRIPSYITHIVIQSSTHSHNPN